VRARSTRRGKTRARKCSRRDAKGRVRSNAPRSVCARACAREPATCPKQQQRPSLFSEKGCGPSRSGGLSESPKSAFDRTRRVGAWVLPRSRVQLFLRSRSEEYFQVFLGHASIPARRAGTERYRPCRSLSSVIAVPRTDDHDAR
jgi:hypothetical protein